MKNYSPVCRSDKGKPLTTAATSRSLRAPRSLTPLNRPRPPSVAAVVRAARSLIVQEPSHVAYARPRFQRRRCGRRSWRARDAHCASCAAQSAPSDHAGTGTVRSTKVARAGHVSCVRKEVALAAVTAGEGCGAVSPPKKAAPAALQVRADKAGCSAAPPTKEAPPDHASCDAARVVKR